MVTTERKRDLNRNKTFFYNSLTVILIQRERNGCKHDNSFKYLFNTQIGHAFVKPGYLKAENG